jgi:hypothetical protein
MISNPILFRIEVNMKNLWYVLSGFLLAVLAIAFAVIKNKNNEPILNTDLKTEMMKARIKTTIQKDKIEETAKIKKDKLDAVMKIQNSDERKEKLAGLLKEITSGS